MAIIEMTGKTFGRLKVINRAPNKGKYKRVAWYCKCNCGNLTTVIGAYLRNGNTTSCGCFKNSSESKHKTHGLSKKISEYAAWENMKRRCYYTKSNRYEYYGGRGITVCNRWINSFENFYSDMGAKPSKFHTLERIDVNKNYDPENCKWIHRNEQARNKTNTKYLTIDSVTKRIAEWALIYGVKSSIVFRRISRGWPKDKTLFIKTGTRILKRHTILNENTFQVRQ
jgi:hypothetical protein